MGKHRKIWTIDEKLEILHHEKLHGSTKASREYGVSITSILKWKKAYENYGESGLKGKQKTPKESQQLKELHRENARLRKLVADKELTIMIQKEMLKKKPLNKAQRMMVSQSFISNGYGIGAVLKVTQIARSTYYDQHRIKEPIPEKRGRTRSKYTYMIGGQKMSNDRVLENIKEVLSQDFVDYGYLKVTHWLRQHKGYIINAKKVYRLMKEEGLLNKYKPKKRKPRNWVKELVPDPDGVFEYLELDIKYMYVSGRRKNALILSVIDVKSRWVLGQIMKWSITSEDVLALFDQIFEVYPLPKSFYIRNDNGSQFEAGQVQVYFEGKQVTQEFCKPATPEQNAHIESYHSIIEKVVCQRYEFDNLAQCQQTMNRFIKFYNMERIHSGIGYICPKKYLRNNDIDLNIYQIEQPLNCTTLQTNVLV